MVRCFSLFTLIVLALVGCQPAAAPTIQPLATVPAERAAALRIVTGQTVFVPAYSEIVAVKPALQLYVTLAVHNTDLRHPIIIKSVRYYNTSGDLVRDFVQSPTQLNPMATTGFTIDDDSGGWGANFLVEWGAEEPVYEPVIEAIMVSRRGTEGVSFISLGRVVSEQTAP
jgi:hypothetical protein